MIAIANLYAYQALDEKYKRPSDPTVEQLRQTMEQSLEWSKIQHEQSVINSNQEPITVFNVFENDDDSLPF